MPAKHLQQLHKCQPRTNCKISGNRLHTIRIFNHPEGGQLVNISITRAQPCRISILPYSTAQHGQKQGEIFGVYSTANGHLFPRLLYHSTYFWSKSVQATFYATRGLSIQYSGPWTWDRERRTMIQMRIGCRPSSVTHTLWNTLRPNNRLLALSHPTLVITTERSSGPRKRPSLA